MAAAVIVATTVQKSDTIQTLVSGTVTRKLKELYLEGPKATQSDWFLLSSYLTTAEISNVSQIYATVDAQTAGANLCALDTFTYTGADGKVVLSGATTGVGRVTVKYWTE